MRFMCLVPAGNGSEEGILPDQEAFDAMNKFGEEMIKAGVLLEAEGLHPSSQGAHIKFSGGKTTVVAGPFAESKELIAGFRMIQVKSKDEAIAWMRRAPCGGGVELELREVFEWQDLGEVLTPELREKEVRLRTQSAANTKRWEETPCKR